MSDPNDPNPPQPAAPPEVPIRGLGSEPALGEAPGEKEPIRGLMAAVEAILREPRRVLYQIQQPGQGSVKVALVIVAMFGAVVYGAIMGAFTGGEQLWASPVKVVLGLLTSALICLPSLYIFACLSGARVGISDVLGLIVGLLALMTLLMLGFAPVAWVFSQSTESLVSMGALHLLFWMVATIFGIRFLHSGFSRMNARSSGGIHIWIIIFIMVLLQMSTALRPLVGTADTFLPSEKKFFLSHWFHHMVERVDDSALTRTY